MAHSEAACRLLAYVLPQLMHSLHNIESVGARWQSWKCIQDIIYSHSTDQVPPSSIAIIMLAKVFKTFYANNQCNFIGTYLIQVMVVLSVMEYTLPFNCHSYRWKLDCYPQ